MLLADFAARLRSETDLEVRGAADVERALATALLRDEAYVLPVSDDSRPSETLGPARQVADVLVGVLVRVRNRRDDSGEAGLVEIDTAREKVFSALLGWTPPSAWGPVTHRRGRVQAAPQDGEQWWIDVFHCEVFREEA